MRSKLKVRAVLVFALATAFVFAGTIKSREDYMNSLPVYKHYKCMLCHASSRPTSSSDLNGFGIDFKKNGYTWDSVLSAKDSDNDGFPNGIELGDDNGDGTAEIGFERSNPGDRLNTPNSINRDTWGILKSLFEQ